MGDNPCLQGFLCLREVQYSLLNPVIIRPRCTLELPDEEFPLWCNGIGGVSASPGTGLIPSLAQWVKGSGIATAAVQIATVAQI